MKGNIWFFPSVSLIFPTPGFIFSLCFNKRCNTWTRTLRRWGESEIWCCSARCGHLSLVGAEWSQECDVWSDPGDWLTDCMTVTLSVSQANWAHCEEECHHQHHQSPAAPLQPLFTPIVLHNHLKARLHLIFFLVSFENNFVLMRWKLECSNIS